MPSQSYSTAYYIQPAYNTSTTGYVPFIKNNQIPDLTQDKTWTSGFDRYYLGMLDNAYDMSTGPSPTAGNQPGPFGDMMDLEHTTRPNVIGVNDIRIVIGGDDTAGGSHSSWNEWNTKGVPTKDAVTIPGRTESNQMTISTIKNNVTKNGWSGVDFDDELGGNGFNYANLATLTKELSAGSTYTFLGGSDFFNEGKPYTQLKNLVSSGAKIENYNLMAYGGQMWTPDVFKKFVGPNLKQINTLGIDMSSVILGATTLGLTKYNLQTWINTITNTDPTNDDTFNLNTTGEKLGGILLWSGSNAPVDADRMQQITGALGDHQLDSITGTYPHSTVGDQHNTKSNSVAGSDFSDVIVGQNMAISQEAKDEHKIDHLVGNGGSDLFVLSTGGNHYKEGGKNDWAYIEDFKAGEGDRLQLSGNVSEYKFSAHFGGMTITEADSLDVIAIVDGISPGSINSIANNSIVYV